MAAGERRRKHCYDYARPAVTVDIVLLRRTKAGPEVLLIKRAHEPFRGRWALPGGFVDANESLETAAARELEEETGLRGIALEQIKAFGDPGRDPRGHTISIVFAGKVDSGLVPRAADDAADAGWHSALRPPPLAFDHDQILHFVLGRKRTRTR